MKIEDIYEACTKYLEEKLPKKGVWGSTETIKAVTRMNAVNILIVNAKGECYFPLGFHMRLKKTVILTFGIVPVHAHTESDVDQRQIDGCDASDMAQDEDIPNTKRNHYNSVVRMDQNDIYTVSQVLATVAYKRLIQEQIDLHDTLKPDEI